MVRRFFRTTTYGLKCQILSDGWQSNLIYMPCSLTSFLPIISNFLYASWYPNCKQSYVSLNVCGHGCGGKQILSTLEHIIKVNNIFIDNPILSPI